MKYFIGFYVVAIFFNTSLFAQYNLSKEKIATKSSELIRQQSQRYYFPVGQNGKALVYQMNQRSNVGGYGSEAVVKIYYDEATGKILDSVYVGKNRRKVFKLKQVNDVTLFRGFYSVPSKFENRSIDELSRGESFLDYQDIWLEKYGKEFKLKSIPEHYSDKDVECSVDSSGKYALISTFVSTYLRSTLADSIITIYNLMKNDIRESDSQEIYCRECIKPQIVGKYIYYSKKFYYLEGADAYDWRIYRAPIFDMSKSELLGEYIEIVFVNPDGRYILGRKHIYGKQVFVILDVNIKKFQYVLGRDYAKYKFFYSPALHQFAFDCENSIIYIEYPKQFPFSAIGNEAKPVRASKKDTVLFWKKFTHYPLKL